jgi:hypothetical protein
MMQQQWKLLLPLALTNCCSYSILSPTSSLLDWLRWIVILSCLHTEAPLLQDLLLLLLQDDRSVNSNKEALVVVVDDVDVGCFFLASVPSSSNQHQEGSSISTSRRSYLFTAPRVLNLVLVPPLASYQPQASLSALLIVYLPNQLEIWCQVTKIQT